MDRELVVELTLCYEELMWLAGRPYVSPARARGWYNIKRERFKTRICEFTGKVSKDAISNIQEKLVREHHNRVLYAISELLREHTDNNIYDPKKFVEIVHKCESVNITTDKENHAAKAAKGNYQKAGIVLIGWEDIEKEKRSFLWENVLRGHVSNAEDFRPII